jgi:hypothetical protein
MLFKGFTTQRAFARRRTLKQARLAQPILIKEMLGKLSLTHAVELCHLTRQR